MNKDTSIYLDVVRFAAAMAVFLCHTSGKRFAGGLFWQMAPYGAEAVDVFFVLSGFVIGYVYDARENTPMSFAVSRFARIYSVAVPALILTFILDSIGRAAVPSLYSPSWHYVWHDRISQILHAVTFTNQIWFNDIPPGSDFPFWSLGFEVWYYVIFGVAVFAPKLWRIPVVILLLVFVGPKIAAMFPIWLMGLGAYHICKRLIVPVPVAALLCLGTIVIWAGYEIFAWHVMRLVGPNWINHTTIIQDYVVGLLFVIHLIGFRFVSHVPGPLLRQLERPIRWVAGATLTLYLFHLPLAQFLAVVTPWPHASWQNRVLIYAGVPLLVFVIAAFTERRKNVWRRAFQSLFTRLESAVAF